jgi:hypothetical protein
VVLDALRPLPILVACFVIVAPVSSAAPDAAGSAMLLHTREFGPDGELKKETWTRWVGPALGSARTRNYTSDGALVQESVVSIEGRRLRLDRVFYPDREWTTSTRTIPATAHGIVIPGSEFFPSEIRKRIKKKLIGAVGRTTINGVRTVHLQGQVGAVIEHIWVKPVTYLAVRHRLTSADPTFRLPSNTQRFTWLRATRTNLNKLKLVVPSGFTRQ